MKLDRFDATPAPPWRKANVFGHAVVSAWTHVDELLGALDAAQAEAGEGHCVICTLDDLGQCLYTSMHAMEALGFGDGDSGDHNDQDHDEDEDDDDDESARRTFTQLVQRFQAADAMRWPQVTGQLMWDEDDVRALVQINREPEPVLDDLVYLLRLPTARHTEAIAGLPNGYFSCDLNVFQNQAVIAHLAQQLPTAPHLGWRFFGIGASLLGFVRDDALSQAQAQALARELKALYGGTPQALDDAPWAELQQVLIGKRRLFLGYTEALSDWLSDDGDGGEDEDSA